MIGVTEQPSVEMTQRWRCIGKLAPGHRYPDRTTDFIKQTDAHEVGCRLVASGVWLEFYVREVWRPV